MTVQISHKYTFINTLYFNSIPIEYRLSHSLTNLIFFFCFIRAISLKSPSIWLLQHHREHGYDHPISNRVGLSCFARFEGDVG